MLLPTLRLHPCCKIGLRYVGKSVISEQYYQSDPVDCAIAKASKLIAEKEPLASPVFASSVRSYCTIRYSSMER